MKTKITWLHVTVALSVVTVKSLISFCQEKLTLFKRLPDNYSNVQTQPAAEILSSLSTKNEISYSLDEDVFLVLMALTMLCYYLLVPRGRLELIGSHIIPNLLFFFFLHLEFLRETTVY